MVGQREHEMLMWFTHYERAVLPFPGGLLNQPNHFKQAMEAIGAQTAKERAAANGNKN